DAGDGRRRRTRRAGAGRGDGARMGSPAGSHRPGGPRGAAGPAPARSAHPGGLRTRPRIRGPDRPAQLPVSGVGPRPRRGGGPPASRIDAGGVGSLGRPRRRHRPHTVRTAGSLCGTAEFEGSTDMNAGVAVAVAVIFAWLGIVIAISFIEAPLKFRAPGVTLQIGLGIGRLVFRAVNSVEVVLAVAAIVGLLVGGRPMGGFIAALVAAVALAAQLLAVRPRLTRRS